MHKRAIDSHKAGPTVPIRFCIQSRFQTGSFQPTAFFAVLVTFLWGQWGNCARFLRADSAFSLARTLFWKLTAFFSQASFFNERVCKYLAANSGCRWTRFRWKLTPNTNLSIQVNFEISTRSYTFISYGTVTQPKRTSSSHAWSEVLVQTLDILVNFHRFGTLGYVREPTEFEIAPRRYYYGTHAPWFLNQKLTGNLRVFFSAYCVFFRRTGHFFRRTVHFSGVLDGRVFSWRTVHFSGVLDGCVFSWRTACFSGVLDGGVFSWCTVHFSGILDGRVFSWRTACFSGVLDGRVFSSDVAGRETQVRGTDWRNECWD